MSRLLSGTLRLHDVADVEGYVARVVERRLRRMRIRLLPDDRDDLISYLIGVAWELSRAYDPTVGSFSGRLSRVLPLRIIDWLRRRFGDHRRCEQVRELPGSDFAAELEQVADPHELEDSILSLPAWLDADRLSPQARRTLVEIVPRLAAGHSNERIAADVLPGRNRKTVERMVRRLRAELDEQRPAA